ncbi:MAG: hypothetical protein HZY73_08620 [Micropruina sp.]|nr:MAG: hypothetical protein HZY73_08620 [Micropruina sp.]
MGGVFTATFDILKRRFGTFVGLSTLSMILPIFVLIGGGLFALVSLGTAAQLRMLTPTSIAGAVVLLVTALIGIALAQLKVQGMLAIGAYEVAQGGRPDAAGLWTRSHGFLRRIIPTMLVIGLIFAGAYLVLGLIIVGILTASSSSGSRSSGPAIMAVLVVVVAVIAFLVLVFVASVKLLYLVSSAALEGTSGTATLKRSWSLTVAPSGARSGTTSSAAWWLRSPACRSVSRVSSCWPRCSRPLAAQARRTWSRSSRSCCWSTGCSSRPRSSCCRSARRS